jgi:hypothetical protein
MSAAELRAHTAKQHPNEHRVRSELSDQDANQHSRESNTDKYGNENVRRPSWSRRRLVGSHRFVRGRDR